MVLDSTEKPYADVNLVITNTETNKVYNAKTDAKGHYSFTAQKHAGMPDSTNVMSVIKDGQFTPAPGLSGDQLAKAGQ